MTIEFNPRWEGALHGEQGVDTRCDAFSRSHGSPWECINPPGLVAAPIWLREHAGDLPCPGRVIQGSFGLPGEPGVERRGHVWQRAFYDHAVRTDKEVRKLARYILANPIRSGMVNKVGVYMLTPET